MREAATLRRLEAMDLLTIVRQPSQELQLGTPADIDFAEAELYADQDESWTLVRSSGEHGGRVLCCFGILESFPGAVGVPWAVLSTMTTGERLALTRAARALVARSILPRLETVAIAADAEPIVAMFPGLDPGQLLAAVMAAPSPECHWAMMVGLTPWAVIRKFGAASQTHVLFERIR